MAEDKGHPPATNKWVGDAIGYSESGASLLRRGLRRPTLPLMRKVSEVLNWPIEDQARATETEGLWASEFDRKMAEAYAEATTNEENKK